MTTAPPDMLARARTEGWADWIQGPADHHALAAGCYFDVRAAERARTFFIRFLVHSTGIHKGKPFDLLDWQWRKVIGPLFGWKRPDGTRRFRRGYLSTPKKNGKTTLLSGMALFLMLADGEAGAEVYSAASDREQASMIFREAAKMTEASDELTKVATVKDSTKTIVGPGRSFYRALSADARRQEGKNASAILFDELHAQPDRSLWDSLRYAGSARRQPLLLAITTAGNAADETSICLEQYQYAKRVIAGDIADPSFFACIFEADAADDWEDEATWHKANPSLGITITVDDFRADTLEAKESPAKLNSFLRYRLNRWVQTADAWLNIDTWDHGAAEIDPAALAGRPCYAGLDLSATDDTTALVLLFPEPDGSITALPWFFLPADNIDVLGRKHRVAYRAWSREGHLTLTTGNVVDYAQVRSKIHEIAKTYQIKKLAIDRKFQGQQLESDLIADGFNVVAAGQGWVSQDLPAKELERLLKAGRFNHGGNPILRWHASNAVVDIDKAGNYSLNKKRSRSKIDGIAAALMALMCSMSGEVGTAASYNPYEDPSSKLILL